jgi:ABC-type polysaccharide/polyol phosphate transport system ATPase subunit
VSEVAIELTDVSLAYRLPHDRAGSLKEHALHLLRGRITYEELLALDQLSLSVSRGEILGVIGPNGAGKSTMMKVTARVLPPTRGRVVVRGRIAAMIELAAGLDLELTTAENIVLYGALLGRDPREVRGRVGPILEWAGLEGLGDVPVRTFSSGMLARLGFAVSVDSDPEVLLVDEVLAVGDEAFQRRSLERVLELVCRGTTVVLVSHALSMVEEVASSAAWLDHGRLMRSGNPSEVVMAYRRSLEAGTEP